MRILKFKEKFKSEGIISAKQFDREDIDYILKKAKEMIQIKNSNIIDLEEIVFFKM